MIEVKITVKLHLVQDNMKNAFNVFRLPLNRATTIQLLQQTQVRMTKLKNSF